MDNLGNMFYTAGVFVLMLIGNNMDAEDALGISYSLEHYIIMFLVAVVFVCLGTIAKQYKNL